MFLPSPLQEGLANGRLAGVNPDPGFVPKQSLLSNVAQSYNTTVDALALAVVLSQQFKPMVLSGACTVDQLRCVCMCVLLWRTKDWSTMDTKLAHLTAYIFTL
eukprot:1137947-Pelagomonas_calceolata.AAC.16